MVFRSSLEITKDSNGTDTRAFMASSSALKSQPFPNFQFHDLKWGMNHTNSQRLRKLSNSSRKSPQPGDNDSDSNNHTKKSPLCEAPPKNGASFVSSHDRRTEKFEKKFINSATGLADNNSEKKDAPLDVRSKICIRFRTKNPNEVAVAIADVGNQNSNAMEAEELVPKMWNLRPRKQITKRPNQNQNGAVLKIGALAPENKTHKPESTRSRNVSETKAAEKKVKMQKFSLPLSREEIEEDIFAMTGSKPSRRPKKRVKSVQNYIEGIFPGCWLDSITPDSYKAPEAPSKGR